METGAAAPMGHRCVSRKGDEITFTVNPGDQITEIRFVHPPEAEIATEEVSVVDTIINDYIFGYRTTPNCHCPLLLGMHHKFPEIQVGMVIHHKLGSHNNKPIAASVRVDWANPYGEGEGND